MSGEKKPPIIKKVIKKGHGGHHGGSWKVAYADFVTAMMAFFLVMWLLAISSESGREALADYYNELTFSDAVFNGGIPSAFNEKERPASILEGGCFSPRDSGNETSDTEDSGDEMSSEQMAALLKTAQEFLEHLESLPEGAEGGEGSGEIGRGEAAQAVPMNQREQEFADNLQNEIKENLGEDAAGQIIMEKVKGGLRLQIIDHDGRPTFRSGGVALTPEGKSLIELVAQRLAGLPNRVSIEGHTDAKPFADQRMTNWELSTARASATRVALTAAGVQENRLTAVTGYAATQPLAGVDPYDPANRRVSIMLWDEEQTPKTPAVENLGSSEASPSTRLPLKGDSSNKLPQSQRPSTKRPPKPLSREELEQQLIDSVMEKSATPDLSTVGPGFAPIANENKSELP